MWTKFRCSYLTTSTDLLLEVVRTKIRILFKSKLLLTSRGESARTTNFVRKALRICVNAREKCPKSVYTDTTNYTDQSTDYDISCLEHLSYLI